MKYLRERLAISALNEASTLQPSLLSSINKATGQDFEFQDEYAPDDKIGLLYTSMDRKGLLFQMEGPKPVRIDYWTRIKINHRGYPETPNKSIIINDNFTEDDIAQAVKNAIDGKTNESDEEGKGSHDLPPVVDGKPVSYGTTHDEATNKQVEKENEKRQVTPEFLQEVLQDKLEGMLHDDFDGLLIYGDKGIGKSFPVKQFLQKHNIKYKKIKGKVTTGGLFEYLWEYRKKGQWLWFDDCDSVFSNEDSSNFIKAALDTDREERWITNKSRTGSFSATGMSDEEIEKAIKDSNGRKLPDTFFYEGKFIAISNLKTSQIEPAILSRCQKVCYELTHAQIWDLTEHLMNTFKIARTPPTAVRKFVLELMKEHWKLAEKPDFRVFMSACATFMRVYQRTGDGDKASMFVLNEIGGLK